MEKVEKVERTGKGENRLPKLTLTGKSTYKICTTICRVWCLSVHLLKIITMGTSIDHQEKARFDTRLSKQKKFIIEKAARLGGYKNLSDFVVTPTYEKAQMIIQQSETFLSFQSDNEIFFNALINLPMPN